VDRDGELLYLNGTIMPSAEGTISVEDRGFQFGDGIYEVIKVMSGRLVYLEDHLERLRRSLAEIDMPTAVDGHHFADVLPDLVTQAGLETGFVYMQVTRGPSPRDYAYPEAPTPTVIAYTRPMSYPDEAAIMAGVELYAVDDPRWARCNIKSTNLLGAVLAKEEARREGADEVVFLGPGRLVREGGSSNCFAVIEGTVRTHPLDRRILAGITRHHVLRLARGLGLPVEETAVDLSELFAADEAFITSTGVDVMPAVRIAGRPVADGRPGPVTLGLADALRADVAAHVGLPTPVPLTR
jgi:D-alanine transaminase